MPAISPGIPINYLCILMLFIAIYSILKYNIFSLQLGSKSILRLYYYTGVSWGDATFAKQVMESMRRHWCRKGAPETQDLGGMRRLQNRSWSRWGATDAEKGRLRLKIYKHDNVVEQPGNTMNTILLDVISERFWKYTWLELLRGLVESHVLPRSSELFEAFPLIAFLPENNSSTKTMM